MWRAAKKERSRALNCAAGEVPAYYQLIDATTISSGKQ
jgi:hypothetical protein